MSYVAYIRKSSVLHDPYFMIAAVLHVVSFLNSESWLIIKSTQFLLHVIPMMLVWIPSLQKLNFVSL
jgi:hypothetical protein